MSRYLWNFTDKQRREARRRDNIRMQIKEKNEELKNLLEIAKKSKLLQQATLDEIEQTQSDIIDLNLKLTIGVYDSDKIESRILHVLSFKYKAEIDQIDYRGLTTEKKQALLRIAVSKILLSEDGTIEIVWKK